MTKKITVGINGTVFKNPVTGVAKRLIYLILATKKKNPFIDFIIFSPYPFFVEELKKIPRVIKKNILGEWCWIHFTLPRLLAKKQVAIFDSIWGGGIPFISPAKRSYSIVVTYHDFIPSDKLQEKNTFFASLIIAFLNKRIQKNLEAADKVILVAPDVLRKLNFYFKHLPPKTLTGIKNKVVISPNGIDSLAPPQKTEMVKVRGKAIKNYFLYVGGFNSRKNVPTLIKAYKSYATKTTKPVTLILVGKENTFFQKAIYPQIKNQKNIISLGYLLEKELMTFYQKAKLLFYPSLKEGFGMPPLEALANNCPAVVDHNLPLNDWKLKGLHPVDMKNPNEITDFMLGKKKIEQPQKSQLNEFKWDNIAKKYYQEVYLPLSKKE